MGMPVADFDGGTQDRLLEALERIAAALERAAPPPPPALDLEAADAFVWHAGESGGTDRLDPVLTVSRVPLDLLRGIDRQIEILLDNTRRFARGLPANNALLWGARGMGKSSLVKAAHGPRSSRGAPAPSLLGSRMRDRREHGASACPRLRTHLRRVGTAGASCSATTCLFGQSDAGDTSR